MREELRNVERRIDLQAVSRPSGRCRGWWFSSVMNRQPGFETGSIEFDHRRNRHAAVAV
jgi:hypothetical protein